MNPQTNYFKLGLFILTAIAIFAVSLMALGLRHVFQKTIRLETYFDQPVTGLETGSPVRFRGVKIGTIMDISMLAKDYDLDSSEATRLIVVRMEVDDRFVRGLRGRDPKTFLKEAKDDGLRAQFALSGITGVGYIEIDYKDPVRYPAMPINWEPRDVYLPSAEGRIARIAESLEKVAFELERSNVGQIASDVGTLVKNVNEKVQRINLDEVTANTNKLLAEVRDTNAKVQGYLDRPELVSLPTTIGETTKNANTFILDTRKELLGLLADLRTTAQNLEKASTTLTTSLQEGALKKSLEDFSASAASIRVVTDRLPTTLTSVERTTRRLEGSIASQQEQLDIILGNARSISEYVRRLSETADQYPSYVLFGEAPTKSETEQ